MSTEDPSEKEKVRDPVLVEIHGRLYARLQYKSATGKSKVKYQPSGELIVQGVVERTVPNPF
jgi:hypothetical protein